MDFESHLGSSQHCELGPPLMGKKLNLRQAFEAVHDWAAANKKLEDCKPLPQHLMVTGTKSTAAANSKATQNKLGFQLPHQHWLWLSKH